MVRDCIDQKDTTGLVYTSVYLKDCIGQLVGHQSEEWQVEVINTGHTTT